jgi:hypothetical protein
MVISGGDLKVNILVTSYDFTINISYLVRLYLVYLKAGSLWPDVIPDPSGTFDFF